MLPNTDKSCWQTLSYQERAKHNRMRMTLHIKSRSGEAGVSCGSDEDTRDWQVGSLYNVQRLIEQKLYTHDL